MTTDRAVEVLLSQQRRFLSFLTPRLGSEEAARDFLQSAMVKALERGGGIQTEENTVAWFFRLLRNALIDRARQVSAEQRALDQASSQVLLDEDAARELERHICACVTTLTGQVKPEYAQALQAVELEGRSLREYAAATKISEGNARVRLHRARQAVTRKLLEVCGGCCQRDCSHCPCEV